MYEGFEDDDLSDGDNLGKALDHLAKIYFTAARARNQRDGTLPMPPSPWFHKKILVETINRYQKDLRRSARHPNEFKQAGYLTFWIRKLKPFRHYPIFGETATNELLALYFGLATLAANHPQCIKKIVGNKRLWKEWIYDLRYRAVSGHELSRQFEMLSLC